MINRIIKTCLAAIRFLSSFLFTHTIEEKKSEISGKLEVLYTNGKYVLDTAHVNYSFGGLHTVFRRAFGQSGIKQREIKNVLILGFGSGSAASILQEEYGKDVEIVGVEKDKEVIELAKKYFSVDKYRNLSLHCEDVYDFVPRCNQKFDLIVMDVFVDLDVPEKFFEENFISALNILLSDKGILFYNLVIHNENTRDKGTQLYKKMNQWIGNTEWVRMYAGRTENWVFVCRKEIHNIRDRKSERMDGWQKNPIKRFFYFLCFPIPLYLYAIYVSPHRCFRKR